MIELLVSSLIICIAFIKDPYIRNMVFVFGSIGLWCFSMMLKRQRDYRSLPLALFLLWSLICIFARDYGVNSNSILSYYVNVYLLSEGFVYILAGALLLKTVVEYSTHHKVYYLTAGIAALPWLCSMLYCRRISVLAGCSTAWLLYAVFNKRKRTAVYLALFGLCGMGLNWGFVSWKFYPRLLVWKEMLVRIAKSPIIGVGFTPSINDNNLIWTTAHKYGFLLKHNDYLHVGMAIGVIGMILITWFITRTLWGLRHERSVILPLGIAIAAFFQSTMFDVHKASIFVVLLSISMLIKRRNYGSCN